MESKDDAPKSIDEYISRCPPEVRAKLERLRKEIRAAAPGSEERISYKMPAFALGGILVYFAAHERHIGFYPTGSGIEAFQARLSAYKFSKGAVQFPIDEEPPYDLIREIVRFRVEENGRKAAGKKAAR
jgi:uncharacterized protein YdhG (YjbR/CyaY superfamily)